MKKIAVFYEGWGERWQLATIAEDGHTLLFEYSAEVSTKRFWRVKARLGCATVLQQMAFRRVRLRPDILKRWVARSGLSMPRQDGMVLSSKVFVKTKTDGSGI